MQKPWQPLEEEDTAVYQLIEAELKRQADGLELIASENFATSAVVMAAGSVLTNKYAEGRPGKRYYGGCEQVDQIEQLAIARACELFTAKFANVQPHAGAQANAAVLLALAAPGAKILGLDLSHGGHLTHGMKLNFSGTYYEPHTYTVDTTTGRLDLAAVRAMAHQVKPQILIAGASAYPRQWDFAGFRAIADEVGAYLWVDMAHIAGLVAAGLHPHPLPHAHVVTTTTHKTLRGPRGGLILWNDSKLSASLNKGVFPGTQGGPLMHIIAAKAVAFKEALEPTFTHYQRQVLANATQLAKDLMDRGFDLVSGGTDNHLLVVDLSKTAINGQQFEQALEQAGLTVNKNTIPGETRSPMVTSGVRLGTPAVTTRGMAEPQMTTIADFMKAAFDHAQDPAQLAMLANQVKEFVKGFPLYPQWQTQ